MAKIRRGPQKLLSCISRWVPQRTVERERNTRKTSRTYKRGEYEDATCSVCMEFPHSAVLLLCSSHDKGCRPYMCGTSYKYSNCLDQFMKAYSELACPLCRGEVKGWTRVDTAREYFNSKSRICMQEGCSFVGNYKDLRRHMKNVHPSAKPRELDPLLKEKWKNLEHERDHEDVMSVIRASAPGAVVWGDFLIEGGGVGIGDDSGANGSIRSSRSNMMNFMGFFHAFENSSSFGFDSRSRIGHRASSGDNFGGSDAHSDEEVLITESGRRTRRSLRRRRRWRHNDDNSGLQLIDEDVIWGD